MATPELEGMIGYLLASMEGADPARTALVCLFHDTQESRIGDVPRVGRSYVVTAPNPQVTTDQVAGFPGEIGQAIRALVDDYEGQESVEARLARDADKLECQIQAREYQANGHDVQPWVETAAAALRSEAARRFADAFRRARPDQWWKSFAAAADR
jgi:5'-deoxynucleotidase YfbR-like HD superfamily hydrolase